MLKHNGQQRFYYFPAMERDEALLIKVWDQRSPAVGGGGAPDLAPFSFHSAFDHEEAAAASPGAVAGPERASIEVRTVAFFGGGGGDDDDDDGGDDDDDDDDDSETGSGLPAKL